MEKGSSYESVSLVAPNASHYIPTTIRENERDKLKTQPTPFLDSELYGMGLGGNSYASPTVTAMLGVEKSKHPNLVEQDFVAGALLAAQRVKPKLRDDSLQVLDNGAGIAYDAGQSGFGLLLPEVYAEVMQKMADIRNDNPEKATQEVIHYSQPEDFQQIDKNTYAVNVDSNATVLRNQFWIEFKDKGNIPDKLTLVSPSGAEIAGHLMTTEENQKNKVSETTFFITTDGFFGNDMQGEKDWQVKVPEGSQLEIESISMKVLAVEKGGVIDKMIDTELERHDKFQGKDKPPVDGMFTAKPMKVLTEITPDNINPIIAKFGEDVFAGLKGVSFRGNTEVINTPQPSMPTGKDPSCLSR